jgi:hypothetical protein
LAVTRRKYDEITLPSYQTEDGKMAYRTRTEAGGILKTKYKIGSKKTLEHLASVGGGPEFHKAGPRVLYTDEALDKWALSKIGPPQASTAENVIPTPPPGPGSRPRGRPRRVREVRHD